MEHAFQDSVLKLHRHFETLTGLSGIGDAELTQTSNRIARNSAASSAQGSDAALRSLTKLHERVPEPDKHLFEAQLQRAETAVGTQLTAGFATLLVDIAADPACVDLLASRASLHHPRLGSNGSVAVGATESQQQGPAAPGAFGTRSGEAGSTGSALPPDMTTPVPAVGSHRMFAAGSTGVAGSVPPASGWSGPALGAQGGQNASRTTGPAVQIPTGASYNTRADNPIYGQDYVSSPMVKNRDYTPTLAAATAASALRPRAPSQPPPPRSSLPHVGDLFMRHSAAAPGSGSSGKAPAGSAADGTSSGCSDAMPTVPLWNFDRPRLTGWDVFQDVASSSSSSSGSGGGLAQLDPATAEQRLLADLLAAFMGCRGRYVRAKLIDSGGGGGRGGGPCVAMVLDASVDACTRELVERVLPLCECVLVLQRFVETRSALHRGTVAQALAGALTQLLDDWMLTVAQLETRLRTGQLSLQGLIYHCQRPMASLQLLAGLVAEAADNDLSAAGLLNLLHTKCVGLVGDRPARELISRLLLAAAAPYFRLLGQWLHDGVLHDPRGEFMVQENIPPPPAEARPGQQHQLAIWHARYSLRQSSAPWACANRSAERSPDFAPPLDVPLFLLPHAERILTTGKYLNAMRETAADGSSPDEKVLSLAAHHTRRIDASARHGPTSTSSSSGGTPPKALVFDLQGGYVPLLMSAHAHASRALLDLLTRGQSLLRWLRSIKHFFLMDQGDLMVHFVEAASLELNKTARDISKSRLQSLLELAVKTSSVSADPYSDDVFVELDPRTLPELVRALDPARRTSTSLASTPSGTPVSMLTPGSAAGGGPASEQRTALKLARRAATGDATVGWELLMINCRVRWPNTLVVSSHHLTQYQLLFRALFGLHHVERQLTSTWQAMQLTTRQANRAVRDQLRPAFVLCQKQMHFVQEWLRHMTLAVIEPSWSVLEAAIAKANNVDEVISLHHLFLRRTVDGALLSQPRALKGLAAMQALGLRFCRHPALQRLGDAASGNATATGGAAAAPSRGPSAGGAAAARIALAAPTRAAEGPSKAAPGLMNASAAAEIEDMTAEFANLLNELLSALKDHRVALMHILDSPTSAPPSSAPASVALLDRREELESLANLIERIDVNRPQRPSYAALLEGL